MIGHFGHPVTAWGLCEHYSFSETGSLKIAVHFSVISQMALDRVRCFFQTNYVFGPSGHALGFSAKYEWGFQSLEATNRR